MKRLLTDLGLLASQQATSSRCDNSHLGHLKPLYIIHPVYKNSQNTIGDTLAVHLHNVFCALVFLITVGHAYADIGALLLIYAT